MAKVILRHRAKIKEAAEQAVKVLDRKQLSGTSKRKEFLKQTKRVARQALKLDTLNQAELQLLVFEAAWIQLTIDTFADTGLFESCVQDCHNEHVQNTNDSCGKDSDCTWPCGCAVWPNLTFIACSADCIF